MSISENLYNLWFKHVESNLEWSKKERRTFETALGALADEQWKQRKVAYGAREPPVHDQPQLLPRSSNVPYIFPHEFLFLLCNSLNRLDLITRLHKPDLSSVLGDAY